MLFSIQLWNCACDAATGYAVRTFEVVRQWSTDHRRDQPRRPRNLRRINLPIARPAPSPSTGTFHSSASEQPMEEVLLSNGKRKASGHLSPMSRVKRQDHGYNKSSPWSQSSWAQQLATNVDDKLSNACNQHYRRLNRRQPPRKQYIIHGIKSPRSPSPRITKPVRVSLHPPRLSHFEQVYKHLCDPDIPDRFYTPPKPRSPPQKFVTPEENIPAPSKQDMKDATAPEKPLVQADINDESFDATNFAFAQPQEGKDGNSVDTSEPNEQPEERLQDSDEDSDWGDEDDEAAHRQMLRNLAESYDDDGFRVPIDGIISPPSLAYNQEHAKKLFERAALEQQTPSKLPKYLPPYAITASSSPELSPRPSSSRGPLAGSVLELTSPEEGSARLSSPKATAAVHTESTVKVEESTIKSDVPEVEETPRTPSKSLKSPTEIHTNKHVLGIKSEDADLSPPPKDQTSAIKSRDDDEPEPKEAPATLLELKSLSLQTPEPRRTPKSGGFSGAKQATITRLQKRLAEKEAARNAYPLVPLSKAWDDKVRHAVNHGHGRFEATMFNKCVPEYSNDPSARSLWLDDAVINDYISMVAKHGSKDDRKDQVRSVAALSSFFFTKISASHPNYSSCAGMLRRAGIQGKKLLDAEKIFIPINRSYHWTLAVIEPKVPEGVSVKDHKRRITVYNSMGSSGGHQVANIILRWIQSELGASYNEDEWVIDPAGESPQQRNTDDCGVFTCTTARQIMLRKYDDVRQRYKETDIRAMRKRIVAELVHGDLLNKQESEK